MAAATGGYSYTGERRRPVSRRGSGNANTGHTVYAEGNTVRRAVQEPERREEQERKKKKSLRKQQAIKTRVIGRGSFFFIISALILIGGCTLICVNSGKQLEDVRSEVTALRSSNEEEKRALREQTRKVNDETDLSTVYDKAVNKLGMVESSKGRVYKFKESDSELVRQYADIPQK